MFDFSAIKKLVSSAQDRLDDIRREQRSITEEIARLRSAPASKADILALVDAWIARSGAAFAPAMLDRLGRCATAPAVTRDVGFFGVLAGSGELTVPAMDSAMCALFGSQIRECIHAHLEKLSIEGEGLPAAEREERVLKLEARSTRLQAEKLELQRQASEAGLDVG